MSGIHMMLMGGVQTGKINPAFYADLTSVSPSAGVRTASITFTPDGTVTTSPASSSAAPYYIPATANIGAEIWVRITVTATFSYPAVYGGTLTMSGGTTGWVSLATSKQFTVSNGVTTEQTIGEARVEFASDAAGSVILATFNAGLLWEVGMAL